MLPPGGKETMKVIGPLGNSCPKPRPPNARRPASAGATRTARRAIIVRFLPMLVSRFRIPPHFAARSVANFAIEGPWKLINLVGLWFRTPHVALAAIMMRTSEPPHQQDYTHNPRGAYVAASHAATRPALMRSQLVDIPIHRPCDLRARALPYRRHLANPDRSDRAAINSGHAGSASSRPRRGQGRRRRRPQVPQRARHQRCRQGVA